MNEIKFVLLILICIAIILKISHIVYEKNIERDEKQFNSAICLLKKEPSYKKYKKVSKKSLHPNMPKREIGDFFDFVFQQIDEDEKCVENNILGMYGENCDE